MPRLPPWLAKKLKANRALIVAEGDFVAIHGRVRGWADAPQVVVDLFRIEGGKPAEHWDASQNEMTVAAVLGGIPMFDPEVERIALDRERQLKPIRRDQMIEMIIEQRRRNLGGGFEVGRVLPFAKRRMVGPFIFFDHMGPLDLAPGVDRSVDVRPHPHIGLSTVTYLFAGEVMHRDSLGYEQAIRPQEVNWMTAGRGITHSERFERAQVQGDHLHGIQAWVALPTEQEEIAPSFSHHAGNGLPQWNDAGVDGQLIAGSAYGLTAGAETHSPLFYAHLDMAPGATAEIPGGHKERALYIATGAVELDGTRYEAGRMLVLGAAASRVRAPERSAVMVLGGEPVGERFLYWNFVSSSRDRLAQAASDWKAGRMKLPDADDAEFIPLPDEPAPRPPAMS